MVIKRLSVLHFIFQVFWGADLEFSERGGVGVFQFVWGGGAQEP